MHALSKKFNANRRWQNHLTVHRAQWKQKGSGSLNKRPTQPSHVRLAHGTQVRGNPEPTQTFAAKFGLSVVGKELQNGTAGLFKTSSLTKSAGVITAALKLFFELLNSIFTRIRTSTHRFNELKASGSFRAKRHFQLYNLLIICCF